MSDYDQEPEANPTRPTDAELTPDTSLIASAPQMLAETPRPEPWLANYAAMARAVAAEEVMFSTWEGERSNRQQVQKPMTSKDNWINYPGQMLWARCIAQLHRELFPDVRGAGIYASEELDADAGTV